MQIIYHVNTINVYFCIYLWVFGVLYLELPWNFLNIIIMFLNQHVIILKAAKRIPEYPKSPSCASPQLIQPTKGRPTCFDPNRAGSWGQLPEAFSLQWA